MPSVKATSRTAELVCAARAFETLRSPRERRLFDPYAEHLLGPALRTALRMTPRSAPLAALASRGVFDDVILRHQRIDRTLEQAATQLGQIVILGAGLDTRGWRLRELGLPVLELDLPSTQATKQDRLRRAQGYFPPADITYTAVDFRDPGWPEALEVARPSAVVWEGVTMYLKAHEVEATARALAQKLPVGSLVMLDVWCEARWRPSSRLAAVGLAALGEPLEFCLPAAQVEEFFRPLGFGTRSVEVLAGAAERSTPSAPAHLALITLEVRPRGVG